MLHDYNFPEKVKGKRGIQPIDPSQKFYRALQVLHYSQESFKLQIGIWDR